MLVDFLDEGRAAAYGRYVDEPTPAELARMTRYCWQSRFKGRACAYKWASSGHG